MKYLNVTACSNGTTWLYEHIGPSGRKKRVPTYRAEMGDETTGTAYHFAVTRDSAEVVFRELRERYASKGECPPNISYKPYFGRLCPVPRNGLCILLWENGFTNRHTLQGIGLVERTSILIHRGPASSLGCMAIAGGKCGYRKWLTAAKQLLPTADECVRVFIEPRLESHHITHLSR